MLFPPSSFKLRLVGFLGLLLSTLFGAWVWNSWTEAGDYVEERERAQALTLVQTLAPLLDGGLHERAVVEHPRRDQVHRWDAAPEWLRYLRRTLVEGVRYNNLETPISTLRLKDDAREAVLEARDRVHPDAMELVLTSSTTPEWRRPASYRPEMGVALFEGQAQTTRLYEDTHGAWISAFAPIRDAEGTVVGLLQADASMSNLLIQARDRLEKRATFGLAVLCYAILGAVLLTLSMTRALTRLQTAAQRLGAGDYATPFHLPGGSLEIQDVTQAFESARVRIASHIEAQDRLASALEVTRHDAEAANRAKSLFLANMSHDLRTPLNAIIGFVQLLRQTELSSEQSEMVTTIQRASDSLHDIVGDILEFSTISEGQLELNRVGFDVRQLVQDTGELMEAPARERGLALSWSCDDHIPRSVVGDPARVRQVLGHLVHNAIQFTEMGRVAIHAEQVHGEGGDSVLRFEVADTGVGMSPDDLDRLFEPFSRNDERTGLSRGTGIGLSLCRTLCRLMGGDIGAESAAGRGSTFWFTVAVTDPASAAVDGSEGPRATGAELHSGAAADGRGPGGTGPLAADGTGGSQGEGSPVERGSVPDATTGLPSGSASDLTDRALTAPPAALPGSSVPAAPTGRPRILLAEDSPVNRRVALHMLNRLGYDSEVAVDGLEAVDALRCESFDAVLMDCQMPRMDGYEAARAIRELGGEAAEVPIIAFTATATGEERERVGAAGMNDLLAKPVGLEELEDALGRWCGAHAAGEALGSRTLS